MSTPDDIARASADRMWAADTASQELGMRLLEVRAGYARLSMIIEPRMVQGHGSAHGGLIFTLADSTFAFACNSYGPTTVAAHCDIAFLRPSVVGDELVAEAVERERYGRNGIYDVTVRRATDGVVIAEFRGKSRTLGPEGGTSP
jgi:acyl-CoA thioesterase